MIRDMALKGISPSTLLHVLQKVLYFLRDRTILHVTTMIANKSLENLTSVLTTGERFYCRLHGCRTRRFFDLHVDLIIIFLEDSSSMR